MPHPIPASAPPLPQRLLAASLAVLVLFIGLLSSSKELHGGLHPEAREDVCRHGQEDKHGKQTEHRKTHECVITLFACGQVDAASVTVAPAVCGDPFTVWLRLESEIILPSVSLAFYRARGPPLFA
jgi:hypothetical protein